MNLFDKWAKQQIDNGRVKLLKTCNKSIPAPKKENSNMIVKLQTLKETDKFIKLLISNCDVHSKLKIGLVCAAYHFTTDIIKDLEIIKGVDVKTGVDNIFARFNRMKIIGLPTNINHIRGKKFDLLIVCEELMNVDTLEQLQYYIW